MHFSPELPLIMKIYFKKEKNFFSERLLYIHINYKHTLVFFFIVLLVLKTVKDDCVLKFIDFVYSFFFSKITFLLTDFFLCNFPKHAQKILRTRQALIKRVNTLAHTLY